MPYCDSDGAVYDSARDRMIFGGGRGYNRVGDGSLLALDFKSRVVAKLQPDNLDIGKVHNARELAYAAHADWVLNGSEALTVKTADGDKRLTRIYDCKANRYRLLDAGPVPYSHSVGWMYDGKRKLVYAFTYNGEAYALRLDPATATLLDAAP